MKIMTIMILKMKTYVFSTKGEFFCRPRPTADLISLYKDFFSFLHFFSLLLMSLVKLLLFVQRSAFLLRIAIQLRMWVSEIEWIKKGERIIQ